MKFDNQWYLEQCPYIKDLSIPPLEHYKKYGIHLGYTPVRNGILNSNQSREINICIASSGIQGPTGAGGVAKCTLNIIALIDDINRNSEHRINLTILYTADPFYHTKNYAFWKEHFESKYLNVRFDIVDSSSKIYGTKMMKRSFDIMNYFINHDGEFDKIIFHDYQGIGFYTLLAKKSNLGLKQTQIIMNTHGNLRLSNSFGKKPTANHDDMVVMYMESKSVELADYIISPSKFYLDWWKNETGSELTYSEVLNNISYKEVNENIETNRQCLMPNKKYSISFFGRLEILKGVELLIQTLNFMSESTEYSSLLSDLEINFIGNPVEIYGINSVEYIKSKCSGYIDNINIITNFNTKQAFEYMLERASVMVFPTLGENSPCVISEAMINEVPFIAADIPGIKELVDKRYHNYNLFMTNNKKSLADGIARLVRAPKVAKFATPPNVTMNRWQDLLISNDCIQKNNYELNSSPLVSVVIPTYNRCQELELTLQSIRESTYTNIEIIVADDGSDDIEKLTDICNKNQAKLILGKKSFKGATSNIGASNASGKYILFFDDDDILHSDAVEKYVAFMEGDMNCDIASCFCDVFDNKLFLENGCIQKQYTSLSLGNYQSGNLIENYFGKGSFIIRRHSFIAIRGFDEDFDNTHMVDFRFYIKAMSNGLNLHIIPQSLYSYRKNSNGSLFYESQGDSLKIYNAKKRILNSIKGKIDPSLHDLFTMLYMNHSHPKFPVTQKSCSTSKWLSESKKKLNVVFNVDYSVQNNLVISSSDLKVICEIDLNYTNKTIKINHQDNVLNFDYEKTTWLDKNAISISFEIRDSIMVVKSNDLELNSELSISELKHKNIRKLSMNTNFNVA